MCIEFPKPSPKNKEVKMLARSNIRTKHKSKPKKKMTEQQKRNKKTERDRVPLNGYQCFFCGNENIDLHEVEWGRNRQISINHKMIIAVCRCCHDKIHNCEDEVNEMYGTTLVYSKGEFNKLFPDKDWNETFK